MLYSPALVVLLAWVESGNTSLVITEDDWMTNLRTALGSVWLPLLVGIVVFFTLDRNVGVFFVCSGLARWVHLLMGWSEKEEA